MKVLLLLGKTMTLLKMADLIEIFNCDIIERGN